MTAVVITPRTLIGRASASGWDEDSTGVLLRGQPDHHHFSQTHRYIAQAIGFLPEAVRLSLRDTI